MKIQQIFRIIGFFLLSFQLADATMWQTLRDTEGRPLKARLVDVNGTYIEVIRKSDGRKFVLEFAKLSESSQTEVINWAKENISKEIEGELRGGPRAKRDEAQDGRLYRPYYSRSKKEITRALKEIQSRSNPGFDKEIWDALTALNCYRYLSGVSYDVELSDTLNQQAAAAAKICHQNGTLSHDFGHFTDKCNLSMSSGYGVDGSVRQYMEDSGANNRARRGHRRWCLYPQLDKTGFGASGRFSAMHCFNHGGKDSRETITYPGKGLYPLDYLHGDAWSVHLDGKAPAKDQLKIEIYKLKQRPTFKIGLSKPVDGKLIGVKFVSTYQDTIVFEPAETIDKRGIFFVRITGGGLSESWITELY